MGPTRQEMIAAMLANDRNCEPEECWADMTDAQVHANYILSIVCEGDTDRAGALCASLGLERTF